MELNLILTIVFIVILVLIGLSAMIGLWKGIWKTSFKMIFRSVLFLIIVFCAQPITSAVCSINFQATFGINFQFEGIQLTTLDEFLTNIILIKGNVSPVTGQSLYATCSALAHSILAFVIFFVLVLLVLILGSLLSTIFYHLIFKHFISKRLRKRKKIRWAGAIFGLVDGLVCAVMIISPISSLGNVLIEHQDTIAAANDSGYLPDDTYELIDNSLTAYEKSILGTVLEYVSPVSDGIMSTVVNTEINGSKINFFDEIDGLLSIINPVLSNVEKGQENELSFKLSLLLAKDNIADILNLISKSNLIISLIPGLISVGTNLIDNPEISPIINELNFNDIDWANDINAIGTFYGKLYDAGLYEELPDVGTIDDIKFNLDMKNVDAYAKAIVSLTDFEVIKKNMSAIMSIAAKTINESLKTTLLPEDSSEYDNITWSHELVCLTNALVKLLSALDINSLDFSGIDIQERVTTAIKDPDKVAILREALCGIEETEGQDAVLGLLDLHMIDKVNIENLIITGLDTVDTIKQYVSQEAIVDAIKDINLKNEFSSLLDIVSIVMKIPTNETGDLDLSKEESIEYLEQVVDEVKNSSIIKSVFPSFISDALANADVSSDMLFGLSVENLNFEFEDFDELCDEVKKVLTVVIDAMDLAASMNDPEQGFLQLDTAKVKNVLVTLYSSKIINADHRLAGTGEEGDIVSNYNFNALIRGLFDQEIFAGLGVTLPKDLNSIDWLDTVDDEGEIVTKGEISHLLDIMDFLKDEGNFLISGGDLSITDITSEILHQTVHLVNESELFSPSLPTIFNESIGEAFLTLDIEVDFHRVKSWDSEVDALSLVLEQLKVIGDSEGTGEVDLNSIDWLSVDPNRLNGLLTALNDLEVMGVYRSETGEYIDNFGKFISKLFSDESFASILGDSLNEVNFYSYDVKTGESLSWKYSDTTSEVEEDGDRFNITTAGEIYSLIEIIGSLDEKTINDISSGIVESAVLEPLLNKIIDTYTLSPYLKTILGNSIMNVEDIVLDANNRISIKDMNLDVFDNMNKSEQKTEVHYLLRVYNETKTDEHGQSPLSQLMDNIDSLSGPELQILKGILDDIARLKSFTEAKVGEYISLHEEIISSILNYVSIDQMVTNHMDNPALSKRDMYSIIISVDQWLDSTSTSADGENSKLIGMLSELSNNNIALNELNDANSLSPAQLRSILTSLNISLLLHQAVPTFMREIFTAISIDSLIAINNRVYYPIDYYTHLTVNAEDLAYWSNEISYLYDLTSALYVETATGGAYADTSSITFSQTIDLGGKSITLDELFIPIDHMNLLYNNKEYIVYNFILQTDDGSSDSSIIGLIRRLPVKYGDEVAARIRKLFFPLGQSDAQLTRQTELLTSFMDTMAEQLDATFDADGLDPQIAYNFMISPLDYTYTTANGIITISSYSRSLFSSEIVAGYMADGFSDSINSSDKSADEKQELIARITNDFYAMNPNTGMDYKNINIVEANGIKGLLQLASIDYTSRFDTIALPIAEAFALMGRTNASVQSLVRNGMTSDDALLVYTHNEFYSSSAPSSVNNSIIASTLLDIYLPANILSNLNALVTSGSINYSYQIGDPNFVFGEFASALSAAYNS